MTDIVKRLRLAGSTEKVHVPGAWCHEAADEIERLRAEGAKLVDENNRLQEWKDAAIAQAEDRDEYVLAQINAEQKAKIERLAKERDMWKCHAEGILQELHIFVDEQASLTIFQKDGVHTLLSHKTGEKT